MRGSHMVAAVEYAYHCIQQKHPELPAERDVLCLVTTPPPDGRHSGWMYDRIRKEPFTIVLTTHTMNHPRHAFYTVLHEAAHVLARVRGVKDMRADGRYHTAGYRDIAFDLGLIAKCSELAAAEGYAFTKPRPFIDLTYANPIQRLSRLKADRP